MRKMIIILLALGHGLNDLIAGYFLGSLLLVKADIMQIGAGLIIYNLLAFGGQYPVAVLIEKLGNHKKFLAGAYFVNIVAVSLFTIAPFISIVLAGIGSAVYHVAGGSLCAGKNKATDIGLFAAPGVAGLIAGGYFSWAQFTINGWLIGAAIIFFILLLIVRYDDLIPERKNDSVVVSSPVFDRHDLIMIILLTVISLRSVIWNVFQLLYENNYEWLLAIALAACAGKIIGGWIADRIGWRLYVLISLSMATPLISFFKNELLLFCIGIGLLQSSIPATTALMIQSVKGKTERGISLSFGTAIIAGAFVLYTPVQSFLATPVVICSIIAIMMLLLLYTKDKSRISPRLGDSVQ